MKVNYYKKIYKAAIHQDDNLLPKGKYSIDSVDSDSRFKLSVVAKLASEGNEKAVDWLIKHGARVSDAAYGYALGGYEAQVWACVNAQSDALEKAAQGFAMTGNVELVQQCVSQVYGIDWSATYGHGFFLKRKAKQVVLNNIAIGFALVGNTKQVQYWVDQGALIEAAAQAFAEAGHIKEAMEYLAKTGEMGTFYVAQGFATGCQLRTEREQLMALLLLNDKSKKENLINDLEESGIGMAPETIKKASALAPVIAKLMHTYGYSFSEALLSTGISKRIASEQAAQPNPLIILVNQMKLGRKEKGGGLPTEVWFKIFEHAAGQKISNSEFSKLAFLTTRLVLLSQLPEEAAALKAEILKATDFKSLALVVHQQKDKTFAKNNVLLLWDKRLSGYRNNQQEEKNEKKAETNSVLFAGA